MLLNFFDDKLLKFFCVFCLIFERKSDVLPVFKVEKLETLKNCLKEGKYFHFWWIFVILANIEKFSYFDIQACFDFYTMRDWLSKKCRFLNDYDDVKFLKISKNEESLSLETIFKVESQKFPDLKNFERIKADWYFVGQSSLKLTRDKI